jgi:glutaredoxin
MNTLTCIICGQQFDTPFSLPECPSCQRRERLDDDRDKPVTFREEENEDDED